MNSYIQDINVLYVLILLCIVIAMSLFTPLGNSSGLVAGLCQRAVSGPDTGSPSIQALKQILTLSLDKELICYVPASIAGGVGGNTPGAGYVPSVVVNRLHPIGAGFVKELSAHYKLIIDFLLSYPAPSGELQSYDILHCIA